MKKRNYLLLHTALISINISLYAAEREPFNPHINDHIDFHPNEEGKGNHIIDNNGQAYTFQNNDECYAMLGEVGKRFGQLIKKVNQETEENQEVAPILDQDAVSQFSKESQNQPTIQIHGVSDEESITILKQSLSDLNEKIKQEKNNQQRNLFLIDREPFLQQINKKSGNLKNLESKKLDDHNDHGYRSNFKKDEFQTTQNLEENNGIQNTQNGISRLTTTSKRREELLSKTYKQKEINQIDAVNNRRYTVDGVEIDQVTGIPLIESTETKVIKEQVETAIIHSFILKIGRGLTKF